MTRNLLPAPPRVRVRWKIFAFMFAFGAFAYLQQKGLAVAALRMMPELGLTQQQIGWLQAAFVGGYSLMQFPGGLLGQRFRPRLVFAVLGFGACAAALVVPLAPLVLAGAPLFLTLLLGRSLLGALQAPIFPVTNGIFEAWQRRTSDGPGRGAQPRTAIVGTPGARPAPRTARGEVPCRTVSPSGPCWVRWCWRSACARRRRRATPLRHSRRAMSCLS